MKFQIQWIEVENLRSYDYTYLRLADLRVLVGENNEGKSSLLKMLDRLFCIPANFWEGNRILSEEDFGFWHPANNIRHRARRLTISLEVKDGRFGRKYGCKVGESISLRFAVRSNGECRLNIGPPKRSEAHDSSAVGLLERLKDEVSLLFLPPVRDAKSSDFTKKITGSVLDSIRQKIDHRIQAGSPREYRLAKEVISKLGKIVSLNSQELGAANDSPLKSMIRSSEVRVDLYPSNLISLIESALFVYISTGTHDDLKVLPTETGNGLQSLLDIELSINRILSDGRNRQIMLVIEEPESFLHPSAQRQFMTYLRNELVPRTSSVVVTTHSPVIVDESKYEEVVLVRRQRHFHPAAVDGVRSSINTSLMTTSSSEIFFARTVVLVEGEGDRALLNTILRRIKLKCGSCPELNGIVVQSAGGCNFYAPWIRLIDSYAIGPIKPFKCVWLMDADAASGDGERPVIRGLSDAGRALDPASRQALVDFGNSGWTEQQRRASSVAAANRAIDSNDGMLFACDLEWALFNGSSPKAIREVKKAMAGCGVATVGSEVELARRLGSKIGTGKAIENPKKHPYIRAAIASLLPLDSLPTEVHSVLSRIIRASTDSVARFHAIVQGSGLGAG